MTSLNLVEFWTVQSGVESTIFTSYDEAKQAYDNWTNEVNELFTRWENGESVSLVINSRLEPDLNGGCYQSYSAHDCNYPGSIKHFPKYTTEQELWTNNPGYNKLTWGNPALVRFSK